jgi:hypothetical protein
MCSILLDITKSIVNPELLLCGLTEKLAESWQHPCSRFEPREPLNQNGGGGSWPNKNKDLVVRYYTRFIVFFSIL